jgi:hypothetical protein
MMIPAATPSPNNPAPERDGLIEDFIRETT